MSAGVFRGTGKKGLTHVALDEVIRDLCETRGALGQVFGEMIGLRQDMNEASAKSIAVLEQILAATTSLHGEISDMRSALREFRSEVNALTAASTALGLDQGALRTAILDHTAEVRAARP